MVRYGRKLIPASAPKQTSVPFLISSDAISAPSAPLFEKERNLLPHCLPLNLFDPLRKHWPCFRSTLAADDHPVDSSKIDVTYILKERLDREEADGRSYTPEVFDAWQPILAIFN